MRKWIVRHVFALGLLASACPQCQLDVRNSCRFKEHRKTHKCQPVGASRGADAIAWLCDDGTTWTALTDSYMSDQ